VDTPAAINRQAWAWLQAFLRDLKDDMAHTTFQPEEDLE
jgi:hypothetical protein